MYVTVSSFFLSCRWCLEINKRTKNHELLKEKNLIPNMATSYLSKPETNFVCFAKVCVDVVKIPLIDILFDQIKPDDLYHKKNHVPLFQLKTVNLFQIKRKYAIYHHLISLTINHLMLLYFTHL